MGVEHEKLLDLKEHLPRLTEELLHVVVDVDELGVECTLKLLRALTYLLHLLLQSVLQPLHANSLGHFQVVEHSRGELEVNELGLRLALPLA